MKSFLYVSLLSLFLGASACNSSLKLAEQGNYYQAVMKATDKLKRKASHDKSRKALKIAYPEAVKQLKARINQYQAANDPFQYTKSMEIYESLNQLYNAVQSSPGAKRVIRNPESFYNEIAEVRESAADEQYDAGMTALTLGTREGAKEAYYYLVRANEFNPNHYGAREKIEIARQEATIRVTVISTAYQQRNRALSAALFSKLKQYERGKMFLEFYMDMGNKQEQAKNSDHILEINVADFEVQPPKIKIEKKTFKKDSVLTTRDLGNGIKRKVYKTVSATVKTHERIQRAYGKVTVNISDANTSGLLQTVTVRPDYNYQDSWITYTGDRRALPRGVERDADEEKPDLPGRNSLYERWAEQARNDLYSRVVNYYQNH